MEHTRTLRRLTVVWTLGTVALVIGAGLWGFPAEIAAVGSLVFLVILVNGFGWDDRDD